MVQEIKKLQTTRVLCDHYSMLHDCTSRFHKVQLVSEHGATNLS